MIQPLLQTEEDLMTLLGQQESIRLEFKQSSIFEQGKEKFLSKLSIEISALANTEGGQIVIGIKEEKKGQARVAAEIDVGIDPSIFSPEWFQQALESRISPYLPGLRFIRVPLKSTSPGRIAIVIAVPKGTTAYQADDKRYHGRSEFEAKPLPDNEIRLRMLRPRVAIAQLQAKPLERTDYGDESHYRFATEIHNVGELTIRRFVLALRFAYGPTCQLGEHTSTAILEGQEIRVPQIDESDISWLVMPGDSMVFPTEDWRVILPSSVQFSETALRCAWKLFLDNAPASTGVVDISSFEFPLYRPPLPR